MFDSPIIDLAIGLFLLFAILATITSAIAESISRFIGLRGAYLVKGLRSLFDGTADGASTQLIALFGDSNILQAQGTVDENTTSRLEADQQSGNWGTKRSLPAYIPGRSVVAAIMRRVTPDDAQANPSMEDIITGIGELDDSALKGQLGELAQSAAGSVEKFKQSVGSWYDDHMDRVSGWYKRRIRIITGVIGAVLVIGLNIQVFSFAQSLYTDQTLRESTVTQAVAASDCGNLAPGECLRSARDELDQLQPGLPLGWGRVADCADIQCNFWEAHGFLDPTGGSGNDAWRIATVLLGWIVLIFALLPGSRFWFDLVNRFNSMRLTGPKPHPVSTPEQG